MLKKLVSVVASVALASTMMIPAGSIAYAAEATTGSTAAEEPVDLDVDQEAQEAAEQPEQAGETDQDAQEEVKDAVEEVEEAIETIKHQGEEHPTQANAENGEGLTAIKIANQGIAKRANVAKAQVAGDAVAVMGEERFETLQAAIDSIGKGKVAKDGIVLLKDVDENITTNGQSFELDLDGHKVDGGKKTAITLNEGTVAIENGTVTGGEADNARVGGIYANKSTLSLKKVSIVDSAGWAVTALQVDTGTATLTDCKMTGNAFDPGKESRWNVATVDFYASKATVDNCLISDNLANAVGGIRVRSNTYKYPTVEGSLVMNNTVVKDNVATGTEDQRDYLRVGGVYAGEATTFRFYSGAIYNNKTSGDYEANDIGVESRGTTYNTYSNILSASKMADDGASFNDYIWNDNKNGNILKNGYSNNMINDCLYLTAQKEVKMVVATVGDEEYSDFVEAFNAASDEKPLKVVAMERGGNKAVSMGSNYVWSQKNTTIDYNGHNLVSPTGWNFLAHSGMLTLKDTSEAHDGGVPSNNSICIYAPDVLTLSGKLGSMSLYYNHAQANFIAADEFDVDELALSIPQSVLNAINAGERQEDYVLATGSFAKDVASKVTVSGLARDYNANSNAAMMARVVVSDDKLVLRPVNSVTIDPNVGSDENPGTTQAPVKTFGRATQIVRDAAQTDNPVAYVTLKDTLVVEGEQTWGLSEVKVLRASGFTGPQAVVVDGGKLAIDGVNFAGKVGLECERGGELSIGNVNLPGDVEAKCAAGGTMNLGGKYKGSVEVDCAEDAVVNIATDCKALTVKKAATAKVSASKGLAPVNVVLELDEAFADAVASGMVVEDAVLIESYPEKMLGRTKLADAKKLSSELLIVDGNLVLRPMGELDEIYLDPAAGSDANDGQTPQTAVQSFAKAKEIASGMVAGGAKGKLKAASATEKTSVAINVMSVITVDGEQTMSLPKKTRLVRYTDYNGNLIKVVRDASLTLEDIIIDGASWRGCEESDSLIYSYGEINIKDGAVLQNNLHPADNGTYATRHGGAIFSTGGTLNMTGGTIRYNRAHDGGGIYAGSTTFNMSGGTIEGNVAKADVYNGSIYASAGGGVDLGYGSVMNMSGGTIKGNSAEEPNSQYYGAGSGMYRGDGGGICLGAQNSAYSNTYNSNGKKVTLNMTGGTIEGNSSVDNGGGIFVQAGTVANITGGEIIDNVANASNETQFGGGGIYVNGNYGTDTQHDGLPDGILNISDVLIADNTAAYGGGGIASCNTGTVFVNMTDGAVVLDNSAAHADDVFLTDVTIVTNGFSWTTSYASVSEVMLGGVPYNWQFNYGDKTASAARAVQQFGIDPIEGAAIPKSKLSATQSGLFAKSGASADDEAVKATIANNVKVRVVGNRSYTNGGGIGTNGTVNVGPDRETSIAAKKYLDGAKPASDSFTFELKDADGNVLQTKSNTGEDVVFDALHFDEVGEHVFTVNEVLPEGVDADNLQKDGIEYDPTVYTVKVNVLSVDEFYRAQVRYFIGEDEVKYLAFNNKTYEDEKTEYTKLEVLKNWEDNDDAAGMRPDHVLVQLMRDGEAFGEAVRLDANDDWKCEFVNLDKKFTWGIQEIAVPNGYKSTVVEKDGEVVVTNKYEETTVEVPEDPTPLSPGTPGTDEPTKSKKTVDGSKMPKTNKIITENETPLGAPETGDAPTGVLVMLLLAACAGGGAVLALREPARRRES